MQGFKQFLESKDAEKLQRLHILANHPRTPHHEAEAAREGIKRVEARIKAEADKKAEAKHASQTGSYKHSDAPKDEPRKTWTSGRKGRDPNAVNHVVSSADFKQMPQASMGERKVWNYSKGLRDPKDPKGPRQGNKGKIVKVQHNNQTIYATTHPERPKPAAYKTMDAAHAHMVHHGYSKD
jgi:hypothetical protein